MLSCSFAGFGYKFVMFSSKDSKNIPYTKGIIHCLPNLKIQVLLRTWKQLFDLFDCVEGIV